MSDNFFETSHGGGQPEWAQHIIWYLGHPEVWVTLIAWFVLSIGVFKAAKIIWKRGHKIWFLLFLGVVFAAVSYYVWLSLNAYMLYIQGLGDAIIHLRHAKIIVLVLAALAFLWIIYDRLKSGDRK